MPDQTPNVAEVLERDARMRASLGDDLPNHLALHDRAVLADEVKRLRAEVAALNAERNLTGTQRRILHAVRTTIRQTGQAPTMQEIAEAVGLNAACNAWHHLRVIEREGFIHRVPNHPRGIRLVEEVSHV